MTALVRLAKAAAWYVPQILTQHHSRKTRAWNAAHPPPGQQYGATWVARRRQDDAALLDHVDFDLSPGQHLTRGDE